LCYFVLLIFALRIPSPASEFRPGGKMKLLSALSLLTACSFARPLQDGAVSTSVTSTGLDLPRLIIYYQTTHDQNGNPISMLPLVTEQNIALTHLIVCSFHINYAGQIHLNDYPPDYQLFDTLWAETAVLKEAGVKIMGMVGGAAPGSFNTQTLDGDAATFEHYYGQLRDVIVRFGLEGMDLDVEQSMSQAGIFRLVDRLVADFGPDFIVTLAPVASALWGGSNLSGFDYGVLDAAAKGSGSGTDGAGANAIDFYNGQFYNGFGSMRSTSSFDAVVTRGWDPARIVAGQVTAPDNGYDFVPFDRFNQTIRALWSRYGAIGGVMGWEYFNSDPAGTSKPWEWAQVMTQILRPLSQVRLTVTRQTAEDLITAWKRSVADVNVHGGNATVLPNVDYMAMVNA
jgi:hypothetical protein